MPGNDFDKLFHQFTGLKVAVIGDVMLDTYWWGNVDRISPEAPVPVVAVSKKEQRIGGAGNVALNGTTIAVTAPFARSGGSCPTSATFTLTASSGTTISSCTIGIVFTPTASGSVNGTLTIGDVIHFAGNHDNGPNLTSQRLRCRKRSDSRIGCIHAASPTVHAGQSKYFRSVATNSSRL